jgi:hypothetical protein
LFFQRCRYQKIENPKSTVLTGLLGSVGFTALQQNRRRVRPMTTFFDSATTRTSGTPSNFSVNVKWCTTNALARGCAWPPTDSIPKTFTPSIRNLTNKLHAYSQCRPIFLKSCRASAVIVILHQTAKNSIALDGKVLPAVQYCFCFSLWISHAAPTAAPDYSSNILPSVRMVKTCHGIHFSLFCSAVLAACSRPPQQGTSIRSTVRLLISLCRRMSASFSA